MIYVIENKKKKKNQKCSVEKSPFQLGYGGVRIVMGRGEVGWFFACLIEDGARISQGEIG